MVEWKTGSSELGYLGYNALVERWALFAGRPRVVLWYISLSDPSYSCSAEFSEYPRRSLTIFHCWSNHQNLEYPRYWVVSEPRSPRWLSSMSGIILRQNQMEVIPCDLVCISVVDRIGSVGVSRPLESMRWEAKMVLISVDFPKPVLPVGRVST